MIAVEVVDADAKAVSAVDGYANLFVEGKAAADERVSLGEGQSRNQGLRGRVHKLSVVLLIDLDDEFDLAVEALGLLGKENVFGVGIEVDDIASKPSRGFFKAERAENVAIGDEIFNFACREHADFVKDLSSAWSAMYHGGANETAGIAPYGLFSG
jgi:hypothetical protein